jgi:hypothetical protein
MSEDVDSLGEMWRLRNAAAEALALSEEQMRRAVREATVAQLATFLESYSPALSRGPEWTRTFDPLIERLWTWRDDATMAALAAKFASKGPAWAAVAGALAPERGAAIRASVRHPAWARHPAFAVV